MRHLSSAVCDAALEEQHPYLHQEPGSQNRSYTCSVCFCSFKRLWELKQHMAMHPRKKSQIEEQQQILIPQESGNSKLFECPVCSYTFGRRWVLKRHMRTHTGERPFQCEHCEYAAGTKQNLEVHVRAHHGEIPCDRTQCSYRATQQSDPETYNCPQTDYPPSSFETSQNPVLQRHLQGGVDQ